jgi:hypothetical protein
MNTRRFGIVLGVVCAMLGVAAGLAGVAYQSFWRSTPRAPLAIRLDTAGPYLILATAKANADYAPAIAKARELHPAAAQAVFDPANATGIRNTLRQHHPHYALVFIEPQELDVNFAWRWLQSTTDVNDDPLVDVRTGFITGTTAEATTAFIARIAAAVHGSVKVPGVFVDDLGPNSQASKSAFYENPVAFMIPALADRLTSRSISHGTAAFTEQRLGSVKDAGLLHFGGHGHPDRVDDGVTGTQAARLELSPCIVFSGACYTGVTHRWYDPYTGNGKVAERTVAPADSFCLNLLRNKTLAYLAALHVDHGMPVYQEMEYLAYHGGSLGDVIKHTQDGVILAAGGKLPALDPFKAGSPSPQWTPTEIMLKGTASRVLFGDPALIVTDAFTEPPFQITVEDQGDSLHIKAILKNTALKSTFTDTYHSDLASDKNLFNDRALLQVKLPKDWKRVSRVEVVGAKAGGQSLNHRLVGQAVEESGEERYLHVQVDVPTTGFQQSAFRKAGATVELRAPP